LAIESNRAGDGVKVAMDGLAKSNEKLEDKVESLEKQQASLAAALPTRR